MEGLQRRLQQLKDQVDDAWRKLDLDTHTSELSAYEKQMQAPDFWSNSQSAQEIAKKSAGLQSRLEPWRKLLSNVSDACELAGTNDNSLYDDLLAQTTEIESTFSSLKEELKFSGAHDGHDAIVSIHAGAGGTDAQDWAQMLLRMYVRWAEKNNLSVQIDEESSGDEAGIKSATFEVSGQLAYGKLRSEHGVHRLVRLSPFNSDNLRQTSFAKVEVIPKIDQSTDVYVDEKDLRVDVYRAGGHGGQSVNTTDSAVRITHIPTGITVAIQNERSQLQNKETAMTILRSKLLQLKLDQHKDEISELKGPNQSAEWGNQIRSYVLHPYKMVKDLRTRHETADVDAVLGGDINSFINAYLDDLENQN